MLERQGTLIISNEFEYENGGVSSSLIYAPYAGLEALRLNTLTFRLPVSVSVKNIYAPYAALERQGTLEFGNGGVSNNFIYAPYAGLKALRLNTLTLRLPVSVSVKNIYAPYAALERQGTLQFRNGGVSNNFIYTPYAGLKALRLNALTLILPLSVSVKNIYAPKWSTKICFQKY